VITRIESVQSLYIEVLRDNITLGSATGFIIKSNTQNYLITNWHVVTNKNPVTKNWLDPKVQISPNRIGIMQNAKTLGNYNVRKFIRYPWEYFI
jgi:S1-C subfamily serine protease